VLLGLVVCNEATRAPMHRLWTDMGVTASPDDCFLGLRGLRTLAVRLARHQDNAFAVATWLRGQSEVAEVLYPALPGARGHALWQRDFTGATGLFGVVLHPVPKPAVAAMLEGLEVFAMGYSWGGFESLALPLRSTRLRGFTPFDVAGPVLRLHIGLEDPADLIADLAAGLARLRI
jgi:cystathionine beta-lyase